VEAFSSLGVFSHNQRKAPLLRAPNRRPKWRWLQHVRVLVRAIDEVILTDLHNVSIATRCAAITAKIESVSAFASAIASALTAVPPAKSAAATAGAPANRARRDGVFIVSPAEG
jgi:hypothetical protein